VDPLSSYHKSQSRLQFECSASTRFTDRVDRHPQDDTDIDFLYRDHTASPVVTHTRGRRSSSHGAGRARCRFIESEAEVASDCELSADEVDDEDDDDDRESDSNDVSGDLEGEVEQDEYVDRLLWMNEMDADGDIEM
jgi:hypothetical protein